MRIAIYLAYDAIDQSLEYLADGIELHTQNSHHDYYFGNVDEDIPALVVVQPILTCVVLRQDLFVFQTCLLYLHQKLSHTAGQPTYVFPTRMPHLLVLVHDLKVHFETAFYGSNSFKAESSLTLTRHGHFKVGLVLRATSRLRDEVASIIEDLHVGSTHVRVVVIGEHQSIPILLRLEAKASLRFG